MRHYRFYKDEYGWFADIPEWLGDQWELQMVAGADKFLDILSQGQSEVFLTLSSELFNGAEILKFQELGRLEGFEFGEGAWYFLENYENTSYNLKMWLCNVLKFVFGNFPKNIYFCLGEKF